MQFLFPLFLTALFSLIVPILIHLFYFRRFKKVYFTNVKFLKEVKEETNARRRLKNILVLMARLFALGFLVLGFAQPFIAKDDKIQQGQKSVSIFIDNSFSMSALSEDLSLLEKAKLRAREIIEAYSVDDNFQVLTNDFEGRHQRLVSQEDALALIDEIGPSPSVQYLSKVVLRQEQVLNTSKNDLRNVYLISDFQENISDFENIKDTTLKIDLIPLQSVEEKNVSIDSAWFEAPVQMLNQTNSLLIKVRNLGKEAVEEVRLALRHEGQIKPVGTLSIPALSSVIDTVPVTILRTGWHEGELTINDYPIQFDDHYFFSFYVPEKISVLTIGESGGNPYLDAAFRGIPNFESVNQASNALQYSAFPGYNLIILHDLKNFSSGLASELTQYLEKGGNVLLFPGQAAALEGYNAFFRNVGANLFESFDSSPRIVGQINTQEFVFNDVFENKSANLQLPASQGNFRVSRVGGKGEEMLLTYRDGSSYLSKFSFGSGHLFVCSAPLEYPWNDLTRNSEIFVPLLYKTAISSSREWKIAYTIGADQTIDAEINRKSIANELIYKLKGKDREFIPGQRIVGSKIFLTMGRELREPGIYDFYLEPESIEGKFAFNYNRKESNLKYLEKEALQEAIEKSAAKIALIDANNNTNFTDLIGQKNLGVSLWRWCLILTLFFLAIEGLLLRIWKV